MTETDYSWLNTLYENSEASGFGLTPSEFCEIVLDVAKRAGAKDAAACREFASRLHADELVLARACALGNEIAWGVFVARYRAKLYAAAAAITKDARLGRELADSLYGELFGIRSDGNSHRPSKFNLYSGRGSLEGWLTAILAQEHVNHVRSERRYVAIEEELLVTSAPRNESLSERDRELIVNATCAALDELAPEPRFILAAYYLDDLTFSSIGRMLNAHESTVKRRMDKAVKQLRKRIEAALRQRGVDRRDIATLLQVDVRELAIDMRAHLIAERQA